jgi:hypothetical protein
MDNELEARTESRRLNSRLENLDDEIDIGEEEGVTLGGVGEDVHVLYNFMQSLDASAGDSGPVLNILKEMDSAN